MGSILKFLKKLSLVFILCSFLHLFGAEATKKGSKYTLNTIETSNGDVYDCVDFYKQPAFSHPLLKNHSFYPEMRPSSRPKWAKVDKHSFKSNEFTISDMKFKEGSCPKGTVPIRRYDEIDLPKTTSFQRRYSELGKKSSAKEQWKSKTYFAVTQSKSDPSMSYYGVGSTLAVWNPQVEPNQYTSSEVIIKGGSDAIITGWTVSPPVYKDNQTRFFIYTVASGSHCFNSQCGFISVRSDIPLDFVVSPVSTMGGTSYVLSFFVYQDAKNGNWWLEVGANNTILGFWPQRIFQGLYDSGMYVASGGEAFRPWNTRKTHMGSGWYPKADGIEYNAYSLNMELVNKTHNVVYADDYTETFSTDHYIYAASQVHRGYFIYGGPDAY